MIDSTRLAEAIAAGPLPPEPFIAALPMYDWPEVRAETDALWAQIRDALRAAGVNAPEALTRRNGDMPGVDLPPDEFDLPTLWRHPNLLVAMTCWGPMATGLAQHVRVVGQTNYDGVEGGMGEEYSRAIVMRRKGNADLLVRAAPTPNPSPQGGGRLAGLGSSLPLTGRVRGGGASLQLLLTGQRLAYSSPDSISGYLALQRDLEAQGSGLHIFASLIPTGGHCNSIRAVTEGRADVAAVDCRSWQMAQMFEPAAQDLTVAGWTKMRLGLPLITAKPDQIMRSSN